MADAVSARLAIVDDHPVVRQGLAGFLTLHGEFEVVAEAGSVAEATAIPADLAIDLVLLDVKLPDGSGLSLIEAFRARPGRPRVVVLTSFLEEDAVRDAMRLGASGYLLKHAGPGALRDNLRAALRGEVVLEAGAVKLLARPPVDDPLAELTPREREVLARVAEGLTNAEIGERLGIAEKTVKVHLTSVFAKMGVRDRTQAALKAKEMGV